MRYKVATVHGESGTVYQVVDKEAPDSDQPAILASYSTGTYGARAHSYACRCRDVHNGQHELATAYKRHLAESK